MKFKEFKEKIDVYSDAAKIVMQKDFDKLLAKFDETLLSQNTNNKSDIYHVMVRYQYYTQIEMLQFKKMLIEHYSKNGWLINIEVDSNSIYTICATLMENKGLLNKFRFWLNGNI